MMPQQQTIDKAWILDATPHPKGVLLWFKLPSGKAVQAISGYLPAFYAVFSPQISKTLAHLTTADKYRFYAEKLADHPDIKTVKIVQRRILAVDTQPSDCLEITPHSPMKFKRVLKALKAMEVFEFYNSDIPLVQIFFYETGLFPFAACRVTLSHHRGGETWCEVALRDSNEVIEYPLPPLRIVWLDLEAQSAGLVRKDADILRAAYLTIDRDSSPIPLDILFSPDMITTDSHGLPQLAVCEGSEFATLRALEAAVMRIDPDIIFTSKGDEHIFPYLYTRLQHYQLEKQFSLSRDHSPLSQSRFVLSGQNSYMSYGQVIHRADTQFYLQGRLHIDSAIMGGLHFSGGNLYGIVEVARISYITLQRLTRVTIGGALQSMQFFHAYAQGLLIPEEKKNVEHFREAANLLLSDRGGHILNPKVGMFERVAELDFTSMYPSLMVKYNVSPEKLNCNCCQTVGLPVPGLPYHTCAKQKGIVALSLRLPLMKRIKYKELAKQPDKKAAQRYGQMQSALKWILVVCFGYLGFRNARFGRIEAHQAVCAYSREFLLNAMEIVEAHGITYLHGIVDSLYVQAPEGMSTAAFHQECAAIVDEIQQKTQIPISYDPDTDYFRFISFLPTKAQPEIGALNRYWGVKPSGKIKVRGLELRRHDAPPLIKGFQHAVITAIEQSPYRRRWKLLLRHTLLPVIEEYFTRLDDGTVSEEDMAVSIRLARRLEDYKVNNYQAIATRHLARRGLYLGPGQKVSFIITDSQAAEPMARALPVQLYREANARFDCAKYKELLIRALNNLLPSPLTPTEMQHLIDYSPETKRDILAEQKTILEFL